MLKSAVGPTPFYPVAQRCQDFAVAHDWPAGGVTSNVVGPTPNHVTGGLGQLLIPTLAQHPCVTWDIHMHGLQNVCTFMFPANLEDH